MEQQYQFIKGRYNRDRSITVFAIDEKQSYKIKVVGFPAYFYVPYNDPIPDDDDIEEIVEGYIHEDGFPVKKIICSSPSVVHSKEGKSLRSQFTQHYEADIPFIRRFLIDTGITSGFKIKGLRKDVVSYKDLVPVNFTVTPKICYVDFEENVTTRFVNTQHPNNEVTAWTAYFSDERIYYTCVLKPNLDVEIKYEWWAEDHLVIYCKKEKKLLSLFSSLLKEHQPHAIAHWYGRVADHEYPEARAKKLGVIIDFDSFDEIDMCRGYEIRSKRLYYRLKDVAVDEGIYEPSTLVASEFHKDMWIKGLQDDEKLKTFIKYNHMDVRILVLLDLIGWEHYDEIKEKTIKEAPHEICFDVLNLKAFVGLENARATFFNSVSIDTFTLRKAYKRKTVLHSSFKKGGKGFHAAEPFSPPGGVYTNIKTLDMSRYYPNIITGYKVDDLMCEVVIELNALRDKYEEKIEKLKNDGYDQDSPQIKSMESRRDTVKFLLNSTYGYLGSPRSRKYKVEKASKIAGKARLGLDVIKKAMRARGIPVIYGHTDSIFIQCKDEEIEEILIYLNNVVLANLCKEEGIPQILRLKLEKICPKGLFVDTKGDKGTEAKARHALHVTFEKGHKTDYIAITGFDYIRGNASPMTRKAQMITISAILRGNEKTVPPIIRKIVKSIRDGKYSFEKIATPITIRKPLASYKTGSFHAKAARWAIRNLGLEIIEGDRIKLLPVKRVVGKEPTDNIAFFDEKDLEKIEFIPDYEKIIKKTIYSKIEQFLYLVNITKRDIEGHFDPNEDWF